MPIKILNSDLNDIYSSYEGRYFDYLVMVSTTKIYMNFFSFL